MVCGWSTDVRYVSALPIIIGLCKLVSDCDVIGRYGLHTVWSCGRHLGHKIVIFSFFEGESACIAKKLHVTEQFQTSLGLSTGPIIIEGFRLPAPPKLYLPSH